MKKINFYADVTEVGFPFIRINEGKFKGVVLLIDTGSNDNMLFGYAYKQAKNLLEPVDGVRYLTGIEGIQSKLILTKGTLSFCGKEYSMTFMVRDEDSAGTMLSEELGFPIAGMIGTKFMVEHGWVIDYAKQAIFIPETDVSVDDLASLKN